MTYFACPVLPLDDVWSEDGKVYCRFVVDDSEDRAVAKQSAVHVGFLHNLERYPGIIRWMIVTSGNGSELRARRVLP